MLRSLPSLSHSLQVKIRNPRMSPILPLLAMFLRSPDSKWSSEPQPQKRFTALLGEQRGTESQMFARVALTNTGGIARSGTSELNKRDNLRRVAFCTNI